MHDLDGRVELQGRTIVNLEEDRVSTIIRNTYVTIRKPIFF